MNAAAVVKDAQFLAEIRTILMMGGDGRTLQQRLWDCARSWAGWSECVGDAGRAFSQDNLTPALSASIALVRERDRYRAERDELLTALKMAMERLDRVADFCNEDLRAVIAKVTK